MTRFTDVLAQIAPRRTDELVFTGDSLLPQQRIFGGQVVAQCLMAAHHTVSEALEAHSLHAYFLRAGNPEIPIEFEVDPIRDGRSFCTRRVVARQRGEAIFNTSISYHVHEEGVEHSFVMPKVSAPRSKADDLSGFRGLTTKAGDPNLIDLYHIERQRVTQYSAEHLQTRYGVPGGVWRPCATPEGLQARYGVPGGVRRPCATPEVVSYTHLTLPTNREV